MCEKWVWIEYEDGSIQVLRADSARGVWIYLGDPLDGFMSLSAGGIQEFRKFGDKPIRAVTVFTQRQRPGWFPVAIQESARRIVEAFRFLKERRSR
jgi:hypothetical protein